jgi:hypothetical protein
MELRPYLGRHGEILERWPAIGTSSCTGELSLASKFLDSFFDTDGQQVDAWIELWECPCGAILWVRDGVLLDCYRRPTAVEPRDLVKELAASFELPPRGGPRQGA